MRAVSLPWGAVVVQRCSPLFSALRSPGGQICVLSDGNVEPLVLSPAFHEKELRLWASSDGVDYQGHAVWFFEQVRTGWGALADLFEAEVQADELPAVFDRLASGRARPVKVLVRYLDESCDERQAARPLGF